MPRNEPMPPGVSHPRAKATRSRSPAPKPMVTEHVAQKKLGARVRTETSQNVSGTASSHDVPPKATARIQEQPPKKAPPTGATLASPVRPKAATTEVGLGAKSAAVAKAAAPLPPRERAGQSQMVPGTTCSDGSFVAFRGEPMPPPAKPVAPAEAVTLQANLPIIPKACPTDADTRPNNVTPARQACALTMMFRMIQDHRMYGTRLSNSFDPHSVLPAEYDRVDAYIWAALCARNSVSTIRDDYTHLVVPWANCPNGFVQAGSHEVIWFLRGWNHYLQDDDGERVVI